MSIHLFRRIRSTGLFLFLLTIGFTACQEKRDEKRILVFSKTAGFRHESIPAGRAALYKLGQQHGFAVDTTEDAGVFTEASLKKYSAIVFLNTTGNVLDFNQQSAMERYIQAGGGFVGIHSATDTEYDWPWYNKLVGAYFESHPEQQNAVINVTDKSHPSTKHLPSVWKRFDEWYNFKSLNPDVKVIAWLDEKSYKGGKNGDKHPFAWYHEYDGGRAFYTEGGHTDASYNDPAFMQHLLGGLEYAIGENKPINFALARSEKVPEADRFTKTVLAEKLDEPMELAVTPDEHVIFVERKGNVKIYDPETQQTTVIGTINISRKYNGGKEAEDGLLGLALDPGFARNRQIYLFYSPAGSVPKQNISRFTLRKDYSLDTTSEQVIIEIPTQRDECCHSGGSLAFDNDGNLFISAGDNTNPFASDGYSPSDERPGRSAWDAQKSSANMNDLRGKILRIHPNRDRGGYTVPDGNLFPKDGSKGKPEIYAMGLRNPYRIAIDSKRNYLYWGDVGPDAGKDSLQGPRGHDEVNQAKKPGFFGWPYFVGDNKPYKKVDFATGKIGEPRDPKAPKNTSPNNTGGTDLPPAQKAFIYYPYDNSPDFPDVGKGGRTAMAGQTYYYDDYADSDVKFPKYYDGKLFIYEWMRNWMMAVTLDENGDFLRMEPVASEITMEKPGDMQFGPKGDLYVLEYGTNWFAQNDDSKLIKIQYTQGNRPPVVIASAKNPVGAAPLKVKFSSEGTVDHDGDDFTYDWRFNGERVGSNDPNPEVTFEKPGVYPVTLTVTDSKGRSSVANVDVKVGNSPPDVTIALTSNRTFFWNNAPIAYQVSVNDKEDGSLKTGSVAPEMVNVYMDYLPQGYDLTEVLGHQTAEAEAMHPGLMLINKSDCKACHAINKKSIGPAYTDVAKKYQNDDGAVVRLANKVIKGGGGVWGEQAMSAHPQLSLNDARTMVEYVLTLADEKQAKPRLEPQGTVMATEHLDKGDEGSYILTATYTDRGGKAVGPLASRATTILRHPKVQAERFDSARNVTKQNVAEQDVAVLRNGSYLQFNNIDLNEVDKLTFNVGSSLAQGKLEVRLDAPNGKVAGSATITPGDKPNTWREVSAMLSASDDKMHTLYIVYTADDEQNRAGVALNWLYFHKAGQSNVALNR